MGGILWVAYLVQCQVGGDDQRLLAAVSAVYDALQMESVGHFGQLIFTEWE